MTSYAKENNVFTRNPMGGSPGESNGLKRSKGANVGGGGTILMAFPMDNVHGLECGECTTDMESMGGGDMSLSHSLSGTSAVQRQRGKIKKGI